MGRRGRPPHPDILTPREWEVLAFLREGLSNPEIAGRLGISRDGVKFHVSEILGKLGLSSREEAAAWRPEEHRPSWMTAAAPMALLWRKAGALPVGVTSAAMALALAVFVAALAGLGLIAFLLTRGDGELAPNQLAYVDTEGALWLVDAEGGNRQRLAEDGSCGRGPSLVWSPGGHRVACVSDEVRVVLWDADGDVAGVLERPGDGPLRWSPSGDAFLYWRSEAFAEETQYRLFLADDSGELLVELGLWDPAGIRPGQAHHGFPLWSPDGRRIAYRTAEDAETRIYSLDSRTERSLDGDYHPLGWALDGQALLVAANYQRPPDPMAYPSYETDSLDLSSGEVTRLPQLDNGVQFWITPHGSNIVHLTRGQRPDGLPGLAVLNLSTRKSVPIRDSIITYGSDHIPKEWVTFSRDGAHVYWVGGDNAGYRAKSDATGLAKLVELDAMTFDWSPDLTMIAYNVFDDETDTMTLYTAKLDGTGEREIDGLTSEGGVVPFPFAWRPTSRE
jgi:DNA-binding CsgD family transcriptional regulator